MGGVLTFFLHCDTEGYNFLNHIVIEHETYVSYFNVEIKKSVNGANGYTTSQQKPQKLRQKFSSRKLTSGFWDRKGVLLLDFMDFRHYNKLCSLI